ncbi:hypothetical protein A3B21_03935 [Candidatus Uhrbacteria bacterium RIFCSPLOWO2_01_FULL_47_24]|uniref:Ribbon-helix-helix protein CopG domain-containing protein n=1 Tax=Candidatus Uhrbacteria bacterium RIFCSPLOWO2_01_FULL_47_24 TaxID=1802401 RepID=A0A1F7UT78_9BACT|nr:MAG: hypothetical protein A2753_00680 [Candidatus Uhrbacteria bacterium RIFCSPHIGHO2_01_FULL_47_11]OGL69121.1 MAG: hypothetical protein A3D58_02635 [Candidatus Uhrbacteria bacterium RIFCSPHIGHO2_02_FULL_46_47]OGL75732.1 MAG: hypothetical protein A3F52_02360 [Candidatus Uhrbacteria bacterium RIFCSPHIGHO2_12_FULL_47_11]OGL81492.1 MAG: hypothetical protein A3B21_03935 [Candidatus Uhrbacteria bacterium RIFCSPLOWO2_01_FULL_47_24]OGL83737.1 MAG: hypothetical protein A3J03_01390 [Candidatus Uhrbact
MRNVINISLPEPLVKKVTQATQKHHFASKSEFFRYLLREWMAGKLAKDLEEGRKEHRAGKTKVLRSMKDLW